MDILGFKHLNLDLSIARVEVIRDAIVELMANEMGPNLTQVMVDGMVKVLNYIGGALIYIKTNFSDRVKILNESWLEANRERDQSRKKQREAKEKAQQEVGFWWNAASVDWFLPYLSSMSGKYFLPSSSE